MSKLIVSEFKKDRLYDAILRREYSEDLKIHIGIRRPTYDEELQYIRIGSKYPTNLYVVEFIESQTRNFHSTYEKFIDIAERESIGDIVKIYLERKYHWNPIIRMIARRDLVEVS